MLLRSTRPGIPNGRSPVRSGALDCYRWNHWGLGMVAPSARKSQQKRQCGHGVQETHEIWRVGTQANMMLVRSYLWPVRHVNMDLRGQAIQQSRPAGLWGLWVSKRPSWFGELLHWLGIICTGKNLPKIGGCSPLRDQTKNAVIAAEHPWPRHDEEPFLH